MKNLVILSLAVIGLVLTTAQPAEAVIFGRNNIVAVNAGGANVVVQNRGLFGRRQNVFVNRGFGANVVVQNRGLFGRRQNVFVNNGFRNNVNVVRVNGRNFGFNNFNRVNVFGTSSFVSNNGNVFAVDAFGNAAFRGNAFNRGFGINGFSAVNRSFFAAPQRVFVNGGNCFGNSCFNGVSVRSFGGCR